jgi:hypothetical protein
MTMSMTCSYTAACCSGLESSSSSSSSSSLFNDAFSASQTI